MDPVADPAIFGRGLGGGPRTLVHWMVKDVLEQVLVLEDPGAVPWLGEKDAREGGLVECPEQPSGVKPREPPIRQGRMIR